MPYFAVTPAVEFDLGNGRWRERFWHTMEEEFDYNIRKAIGCYLFVIENQRGQPTPWYAGKTQSSFAGEVFTSDKLAKYRRAMEQQPAGITKLILYPRCSGRNETCDTGPANISASREIDWLENRLIAHALAVNHAILNVSMTRRDRRVVVYGLNDRRLHRRRGPRDAWIRYSESALQLAR